jgi:sec-independent protein translocase protein TatA
MGFHLPELIVIFVVALLIFGPKKLPEMGAQIGKSINAFKKGMSELNDPSSDSFSSTFQADEIRRLEARRLELDILEREIALKRAEAELSELQGISTSSYDSDMIVEADYMEPATKIEPDYTNPEAAVEASSATSDHSE